MLKTPESVRLIETHYVEEQRAAVFLMLEGEKAAFVDTNTNHAVPYLLEALSEAGRSPEDVDYIIVTHVHLDHAGGTAALLAHCPNATVLAHPKAARHLIDPERLIAGSKVVYGEQIFAELYGEIKPVPAERVRVMEDGEELVWGGRTLRFIYTKGHATHHFSIYDSGTNGVFAGDNWGLGRNELTRSGPPFLVYSCSPPDFDAPEARISLDKILASGAEWVYVPHFGVFWDLPRGAEMLRRSLDGYEQILLDAEATHLEGGELLGFCQERMQAATEEQLLWAGVEHFHKDLEWMRFDMHLNAQGLATVVERRRKQLAKG